MFGISFGSPAMLHALWASLLPILIHLLNRRRTVSVPFSNVALLQRLQQDRMRRVKMKQILLLVLRTLAILLICLAFARPTVRSAPGSSGGARTSAVMLLDRSLSMRHRTPGGSLFDRARRRVAQALKAVDDRDEVRLLLFDDLAEVIDAGGPARIRSRLDALDPGYRTTDLTAAIERAMGYLGSSEMLNRELYLFTDLARNGWAGLSDSVSVPDRLTVFLLPERPERTDNAGILYAGPVEPLLTVDRPATLRIDLANHGHQRRGSEPVQVYLGARRIAQQTVALAAGQKTSVFVRFTPEAPGAVPLRVEIGEDDLSEDGTYHSILNVPEALRVLLVRDAPAEAYYLARGLGASKAAGWRVAVDQIDSAEFSAGRLAGYDLTVLCNVARPAPGQMDALRRYVEQGAGLLVCLGDRVDVRHYNERVLPAVFPARLASLEGVPGRSATYQTIGSPPDHPLFRGLSWDDPASHPAFYAYYRAVLEEDAHPVLSLRNGAPVLAEARLGEGRVMLLASGLGADLSWTDLPLRSAFVAFSNRLPGYLAAGSLGRADFEVGQHVLREASGSRHKEALVRRPSGDAQTIWPEARGPRRVWPVGQVDVPGVWEIVADERVADRFAVHVDPSEPDLTPVDDARISALFSGSPVHWLDSETPVDRAVAQYRYGRELWRHALGAGLLLLLVETLVARTSQTARPTESRPRGG